MGPFWKMKHHPFIVKKANPTGEGQVGKFGWGDRLLKSNGGELMARG